MTDVMDLDARYAELLAAFEAFIHATRPYADRPDHRAAIVAIGRAAGVIGARKEIRDFDSQPPDDEFMIALGCARDGENYTHGRMKIYSPLEMPEFHYAGTKLTEFPNLRSQIRMAFALLGLLTPEQRKYLDENTPLFARAS